MTEEEIILKIQEAKSRGWDCIVRIQTTQGLLQKCNQEIDRLENELNKVEDGDSDSV